MSARQWRIIREFMLVMLRYKASARNPVLGHRELVEELENYREDSEGDPEVSVWDDQYYEEEGDGYGSEEMRPCNDCGTPIPKGDEFCTKCYNEQLAREEWEILHPESRCPPRE